MVHLAAGVEEKSVVLPLKHERAVCVIVIVIMPHGFHGVEIDTQHIAEIIGNIAVVAVHRHRCLHARRLEFHIAVAHGVTHGGMQFQAVADDAVLVEGAVFARTEQEIAHTYRRGVVSAPVAPRFVVLTLEMRSLVLEKIHHQGAERPLAGDALTDVDIAVVCGVDRGSALDGIAQKDGAARAVASLEIDEIQTRTQRGNYYLIASEIFGEVFGLGKETVVKRIRPAYEKRLSRPAVAAAPRAETAGTRVVAGVESPIDDKSIGVTRHAAHERRGAKGVAAEHKDIFSKGIQIG